MEGCGRRSGMALAIGLAALAIPSVASAQAVPDASCPGPADTFGGDSGPDVATARFAQTFTAQNTGALTRAQLSVDKAGSAGDYVVTINAVDPSGFPTDTVLASTAVPDGSVPSGQSTITADFAAPAVVTAGQEYALTISRPTSDFIGVGFRTTNPCQGEAYEQTIPNPWDVDCGNTPEESICDLVFAVFVELPPLPPEPIAKADRTLTLDSNKGKTEKGRKVTLSGQIDAPTNEAGCEPNQTIELQRKKKAAPDTAFTTFASVQTDATGNFSDKVKVKKTRIYRAQVSETEACDDELSNTQKVRVQKPKAAKEA
jgi:hypothetical protein